LGNGTTNDAWSPGLVLWPVLASPPAITLTGKKMASGVFQFAFTNNPATLFAVLMTTNLSLPLSNWNSLGTTMENSSGQFQFTDPQATSDHRRFYRVRTP
jgi:hypothetical protein